jgi:hypothetical protein
MRTVIKWSTVEITAKWGLKLHVMGKNSANEHEDYMQSELTRRALSVTKLSLWAIFCNTLKLLLFNFEILAFFNRLQCNGWSPINITVLQIKIQWISRTIFSDLNSPLTNVNLKKKILNPQTLSLFSSFFRDLWIMRVKNVICNV